MSPEFWALISAVSAAATTVITIVVASLTWRMAAANALSAESSRDSARIALVQTLASVQPRLIEVDSLDVHTVRRAGLMSNDASSQAAPISASLGPDDLIPIALSMTIKNVGSGPAVNLKALWRIGSNDIDLESREPAGSLLSGDTLSLTGRIDRATAGQLAMLEPAVAGCPDLGQVIIACDDVLGCSMQTSWPIIRDQIPPYRLGGRKFSLIAMSDALGVLGAAGVADRKDG